MHKEVLCRFEDHEDALQHLPWPAQSPDLNIIKPLWPVLDSTVISTVPPPSPLKQPEDVLHGQWHSIPLQTVQNLYQSTARTQAISQQMVAQLHVNNEMCIFHNCLLYFVHPLYMLPVI
jgi:hypothetical protein